MRERTETVGIPEPGPSAVRLFAPGSELGRRFEIRSVLGTGGSAVVYAARDRDLKRNVALKALRDDRMTETALKRFRREVAVARDADSPRLVRVYDVGEAGGIVFLTMELVEGESLRDRLAGTPLEQREALRLAGEVLRALADLHRLGIVHRDVKPANVLLGRDGAVKLADFGLARHWDGCDTRATETEGLVGTMSYLAPEQALGKPVDARTDLYAFGVVLYEMLAGSVPFPSASALGGVVARLHEEAPDVRKARPGVPAWLAAVVAKALERDPARRYASAADLLADLEAERAPGSRRSGRRRWGLAGAATIAALAVAGAWLAAGGPHAFRREVPHLQTEGRFGLKAVDESGRVLWRRADVAGSQVAALVRTNGGKRLRLAAVVSPKPYAPVDEETRAVSLLDPFTGELLERHRLPSGSVFFPAFSDTFRPNRVSAVDLDDDGNDEVVADFCHFPFFPAYSVLLDPATGAARVAFANSGHICLAGAVDLDGDGRRELVFQGPNNRMGWTTAVAAVRVPPLAASSGDTRGESYLACSPDLNPRGSGGEAPLWYALGAPTRNPHETRVTFDPASRLLTLGSGPGRWVLTAAGFDPGSRGAGGDAERQGARNRAYSLLREAFRREAMALPAEALDLARQAVDEARASGDGPLTEWATRVKGRLAIEAGRRDDGEKELAALAGTSDAAPNIAWELARALHLAGDLRGSVRWYAWGLARAGSTTQGRSAYEFLEGELFALVEGARWQEAGQAVDRFEAASGESRLAALYRGFLRWRKGERPDLLPVIADSSADFERYWALEARLANGQPLDALARDVEAERAAASDTRSLLLSLSSEIEARRGNLALALEQATQAWNEVQAARAREPWARAHAAVVAERLARLAGKAGQPGLARETRREMSRSETK